MTRLRIATRWDAIEYLRNARSASRLPAEAVHGLLRMFPVTPTGGVDDRCRDGLLGAPQPDSGGAQRCGGGGMECAPLGPDVLAYAARILPSVAGAVACSGDVHQAFLEALCRLGLGADRHDRLRLADEARDMFAGYLVAAGKARPKLPPSSTVRGWVVTQDLVGVQLTLARAAGYWHAELAVAL